MLAVFENGYSIRYASKDLQHDREVVMQAVSKGWIDRVPEVFKSDKEVVLKAVINDK